MRKKIIVLGLLVFFLVIFLFPLKENRIKIHGYVKDENGNNIKDVNIKIDDIWSDEISQTNTDEKGYYEMEVKVPTKNSNETIFYKGLEVSNGYRISVNPSNSKFMPSWKILPIDKKIKFETNFTLLNSGIISLEGYDKGGNAVHSIEYPYTTDFNWKVIRSEYTSIDDKPTFIVQSSNLQVLNLLWEVPGFGKIILRADNESNGYNISQGRNITININCELAKTAYLALENNYRKYGQNYYSTDDFEADRALAKAYLDESKSGKNGAESSFWCDKSLNYSLWLNEKIEIEKAKQDIEKYRKHNITIKILDENGIPIEANITYKQISHEFLFGFLTEECPIYGMCPPFDNKITNLFKDAGANYRIAQLYWANTEPQPGNYTLYVGKDGISDLHNLGFKVGAEGLVVLEPGKNSETLSSLSFEALNKKIYDHVNKIANTYSNKIDFWIVSHEASYEYHALGFTRGQNIEFIKTAIKAVKDVNPNAKILVYSGYPDGNFAGTSYQGNDDNYTVEPYTFYQILNEEKVDYDYPALAFNYGSCDENADSGKPIMDLASISRMFDWYGSLGKQMQITEFKFSSSPSDCNVGYWHRLPDEQLQTEWLEKFYTIAFSKHFVDGVTYWGVKDLLHFKAKSGIVDINNNPKPAYNVLMRLIKENWSTKGKGETDVNSNIEFRGFAGTYNVSVTRNGETKFFLANVSESGNNNFTFNFSNQISIS